MVICIIVIEGMMMKTVETSCCFQRSQDYVIHARLIPRFSSLSIVFVSVTAQPLPRKLLRSHYAINVIYCLLRSDSLRNPKVTTYDEDRTCVSLRADFYGHCVERFPLRRNLFIFSCTFLSPNRASVIRGGVCSKEKKKCSVTSGSRATAVYARVSVRD